MSDKKVLNDEIEAEVPMKADAVADKDTKIDDDKDMDDKKADPCKIEIGRMPLKMESIDENVAMMFAGQELSEDFKKKAATIFEAAVAVRVNKEIELIEKEAQEAIDLKLAEHEATTLSQIDEYMENVVAEWAEENKLALETGISHEITENFITDLKSLFEKHNISIPKEKVDMLEASDAENEVLRSEIKALTAKVSEQDSKMFDMDKAKVLSGLSEGLAITQIEKLNSLINEVDAKTIESFTEKATIFRDSMLAAAKPVEKADISAKTKKTLNENDALMDNIFASLRSRD